MKQTGLIDWVIKMLGLNVGTMNGRAVLDEHKPLVHDKEWHPASLGLSYHSVFGMLIYLAWYSRPDITYAVNSSVHSMFCAKHSHEEALKHIGCYLKATKGRGLVLSPILVSKRLIATQILTLRGCMGMRSPLIPSVSITEQGCHQCV